MPKGKIPILEESSKVSLLCPTLVTNQTKKPGHFLQSVFKKFVVHNAKELEVLMMHNMYASFICRWTYCAEIAHDVSTPKRKEIVERAAQSDVSVTTNYHGCAAKKTNKFGTPSSKRKKKLYFIFKFLRFLLRAYF
ncbi:hypothetical protein L1987_63945 [Smallanthus sonchifolius]|uniref:Uncharacterized protein n=1 Tax=Smallanthus sonchifolius TaxID=185202 RepID=A0ACB9CEL4_9ASTR|nr:hypothetical protein L1987_63945 [Smallanthus sonchifolius]